MTPQQQADRILAEVLDCGHAPTPGHEPGTGYAVFPNAGNVELCYDCTNAYELEEIKHADRYSASLYAPRADAQTANTRAGLGIIPWTLQTWTGGVLARVTAHWQTSAGGFACRTMIVRFRAIDVHGGRWYGTSPGPGMYARMRRVKAGKVPARA